MSEVPVELFGTHLEVTINETRPDGTVIRHYFPNLIADADNRVTVEFSEPVVEDAVFDIDIKKLPPRQDRLVTINFNKVRLGTREDGLGYLISREPSEQANSGQDPQQGDSRA
jgi:hypothetical protein